MLTGVRGYGWKLSTLLVRRRSVLRLQRHVLSIFPVFVALLPVAARRGEAINRNARVAKRAGFGRPCVGKCG